MDVMNVLWDAEHALTVNEIVDGHAEPKPEYGSNKQGSARIVVYSDATPALPVEEKTEDAEIYTLSGVRIDRITKSGIYIINGKRVLVNRK